ncbi:MAG: MBL fold metallo-hydrolase [Saprospiraceae bacterium]|nr:MBL fold metallo-hydrolase [Saprospiraceae bacterium]
MITTVQLQLLGTGTSQGVPVIGCSCVVCNSTNTKDKRLRTAAIFSINDIKFLIDCGPDLRQQLLRTNISNIHAVLLTHEHADHIFGMDDLRPINFIQNRDMPVYGLQRVLDDVAKRFDYVFSTSKYPGLPRLQLIPIDSSALVVANINIQPIPVQHGNLPILGYRIGNVSYITDCRYLSDEAILLLQNTKHLVINGLHWQEHHAHLTIPQAVTLIQKIKPEKAYLTHLSHNAGLHEKLNEYLPEGIEVAYDGLVVEGEYEITP